jgi:hypothetical protein
MAEARERIAILGGTGAQGLGLALRFARAGRPVWIGSRSPERAKRAADEVRLRVRDAVVEGRENPEAVSAAAGGIVILSVPFESVVSTLKGVVDRLSPGTVLVSMAVPLATAVGDVAGRVLGISQGSCAELCQSLAPEGVEVVSGFQNLSAERLADLERPVDCDVIVSGPKGSKARLMRLVADIPGARAVDGGPLYTARYVEALTALLIGLNARYGVPEGVGIRITYLPT